MPTVVFADGCTVGCAVFSVGAGSNNITVTGTASKPLVDLSQSPHIASATVDNIIRLGSQNTGNRNQAYALGSSGSSGYTYFLACATGGTDGSICQDSGIYGDVLAITDSSSIPYMTINSNHNVGFAGNIFAPGANFSGLSASSALCTDSSKNLTTAGCSSSGISSVVAGSSNITVNTSSGVATVNLSQNPTVNTLLVGALGNFYENSSSVVTGVNCGNWGVSQFGQPLLCMDGNGNFGITGNIYGANLFTGTDGTTGSVSTSTVNAKNSVIIGTAGNNGTLAFYPNGYIGFNSQTDTHGNVYWNICYNSSSTCESVSGVRGDLFDINDGSSYYATIDINGNLGLAGAVKATGANFSGLSASSAVCTDASKNLTTSGCSSGGSSTATYRFPLVSGNPGQDFSSTTSNVGNDNSISAYELSGQSIKKFSVACYPNISGDANNPYTPSTAITGGTLTLYDAGSSITTISTLTLPDSPSGGPFVNGATTTFATPFTPGTNDIIYFNITTSNGNSNPWSGCVYSIGT